MKYLKNTIKSYDEQWRWHSKKFDGYDLRPDLLKFLGLLKGKKVLDFGCGNGRDLDFLSRYSLDLTGIDYSDKMLAISRNRVKSAKIIKMNFLGKIKFPDSKFDGICASASLLHVPKKSIGKILKELHRILKKDGILYISVKEGEGQKIIGDDFGTEIRFFSLFRKKEMEGLAISVGFKVIKSCTIPDSKIRIGFAKKKRKQYWVNMFCRK
jgi:ubiquinone/menaquinone biosynthesis C-methylase UbiE